MDILNGTVCSSPAIAGQENEQEKGKRELPGLWENCMIHQS